MEKNVENYIEKFESYFEKANSNLKYSIDKFDTMILSISCGGLIFSMGFLKYLLLDKKEIDFHYLKLSWILFTLTIIVNLISQMTGYYSSKYDIKIIKNIIRKSKEQPLEGNQNELIKKHNLFYTFTNIFNILCLLFFISAIIMFFIFMNTTV